ncbi:MAG: preprotein translocase subunit YajC [Acidimicrobiales bacterium]
MIALVHPALLAASNTKKGGGGSSLSFIFLIAIAVAGYFLFLRPRQQKARKQREMQSDVNEGDEVVTVGGIVGRILEMDGDRVHLLTGYHATPDLGDSPPQRMTFVRNAISRKVEPPVAEAADGEDGEFAFEQDVTDEETGAAANGHAGNGNGHVDGVLAGEVLDTTGFVAGASGEAEGADEVDGGPATGAPTDDTRRPRGRGRRAGGGTREGTTQ